MKLTLESLASHLAGEPARAYLITGDEALLAGEAADAIRARVKRAGFDEREVHFIERVADWDAVRASSNNLSLFGSRKLIELRLPSGKPGTGGSKAIVELLENASADNVYIMLTGKLDRDQNTAAWVKAFESTGAWLATRPIEVARLPQWLRARASALGLELDDAAVQFIVERTEGNLLAAKQELDKLALQFGSGARIDTAAMAASSSNSARYDLFQFADVVASGDAARAFRVLDGLRSEGTELPLILWALVRAKSMLQDQSRPLPFARITARAVRADKMAKGRLAGEAWDEVALLTADLCGRRVLPLERWQTV